MFEQLGPKRNATTPAQIPLENKGKVILKVQPSKNASLSY